MMEVEEERSKSFAEPEMYDPSKISPIQSTPDKRKKFEEISEKSVFSDYTSDEEEEKKKSKKKENETIDSSSSKSSKSKDSGSSSNSSSSESSSSEEQS